MKKSFSSFSLKKVTLMLCGALALTFTGCIDKEEEASPIYPAVASVYHASPDAPDFDVYLNNYKINTQAFKYSNYASYFNIGSGSKSLKLTPFNDDNALLDTAITFQQDQAYSLFATNAVQNLELLVVKDSLVVPNGGKSSIRFIHLSPDAPAVEINATGTSSTTLELGAAYKENTAYSEITSNTYGFVVRDAATDEELLTVQNISLSSGRIYTFVLRGYTTPPEGNSNTLNLQVVTNY
ncbi:DUF4397 domain-containing protein [Pontibacter harenae]|uniref:DUF4397 domain-containing protein n=1 Tax=Pontibacter harenae TaxID=2894083 RepID=UPI001E451A68|nr:DUF4397 domain-containing protein [Pontibacter harenae]MCC9165498.1 DUF4397 domain-containing protein [Pontibacter harenae]